MGLRGFLILGFFVTAASGALANPLWGTLAYFGHYYLWPERQWWGQLLAQSGIRVSFCIAVVTALGMVVHWRTWASRITTGLVHSHEILLGCFIGWIGLTQTWQVTLAQGDVVARDDFPKMYKLGIALLMITHLATTRTDLRRLLWFMFLVGGVYLGWLTYEAPWSAYFKGRLEGMGGPDFTDANAFAAHLVCMGVLGGVFLLTETELWRRALCSMGGAVIAYGVIATRSRGAFVGITCGVVAAFILAERRVRRHLLWLTPLVALGGYSLTDEGFWARMGTITADAEERDVSAASRLEIWRATLSMVSDHPLGVGQGNYFTVIGAYEPRHVGRDTHNTFLRCLAELGIPGAVLYLLLVLNAFRVLQRCKQLVRVHVAPPELAYWATGLQVCLVVLLSAGMTVTLTYVEESYVFLLLPVALERAVHYSLTNERGALEGHLHVALCTLDGTI